VQKKVRRVVCTEMAKRNADFRAMEHYYYRCIYDVLNSAMGPAEKSHHLKRYKALLIRLTARRNKGAMLGVHEGDTMRGIA
jgi:hypothetical protein